MTQLNLIVNSLPRDLLEFVFFLAVGFTAGSVGIIWTFYQNIISNKLIFKINLLVNYFLVLSYISLLFKKLYEAISIQNIEFLE